MTVADGLVEPDALRGGFGAVEKLADHVWKVGGLVVGQRVELVCGKPADGATSIEWSHRHTMKPSEWPNEPDKHPIQARNGADVIELRLLMVRHPLDSHFPSVRFKSMTEA